MTRSTNKPRLHPTFTLGELKQLLAAIVERDETYERARAIIRDATLTVPRDVKSAMTKIATAIQYREDTSAKLAYVKRTAREAKDHG